MLGVVTVGSAGLHSERQDNESCDDGDESVICCGQYEYADSGDDGEGDRSRRNGEDAEGSQCEGQGCEEGSAEGDDRWNRAKPIGVDRDVLSQRR